MSARGYIMQWVRWITTVPSSNEVKLCLDFLSTLKTTSIPLSKLFQISYTRSSGPGGQKVNKTSSKLVITMPQQVLTNELRTHLPPIVHQYYLDIGSPYKRPKQGGLVISSDLHRSRGQNLDECFQKFIADIQRVKYQFPKDVDEATVLKWKFLEKKQQEVTKKDKMMRKSKKENRKKLW